jgi:hypothetical protein
MGVFVMQLQITNFLKNKKLKNFFLTFSFLTITFLVFSNSLAKTTYKMSVEKVSETTNEIAVYIQSTNNNFELTSYQCALTINNNFELSNASFSYIANSSELNNEPNLFVDIDNSDGKNELTFVSYIGNDIISKNKTLVGKFIIEGIDIFELNLDWNFDGTISTIITGNDFNNITDSLNHFAVNEFNDDNNDDDVENFNLPNTYSISQNYPNPFNPTTNVKVAMKEIGYASLVVYNLLGEKMITVFDGQLDAGFHELNIDASNLPSGIYIYQFKVDNKYSQVKKMNLIK